MLRYRELLAGPAARWRWMENSNKDKDKTTEFPDTTQNNSEQRPRGTNINYGGRMCSSSAGAVGARCGEREPARLDDRIEFK